MIPICPDCAATTLRIVRNIELGPDANRNEFAVQAILCESCDFVGVAQYEEIRQGVDEIWHHDGNRMSVEAFDNWVMLLTQCENPLNYNCACKVHQQLNRRDEHGILHPIEFLDHDGSWFPIQYL